MKYHIRIVYIYIILNYIIYMIVFNLYLYRLISNYNMSYVCSDMRT